MPVVGLNSTRVHKYHRHIYQGNNKMVYGAGFRDIINAVLPHVKKIISNPEVQTSAKELGSRAAKEIIEGIKKKLEKSNVNPKVVDKAVDVGKSQLKNQKLAEILTRISGNGMKKVIKTIY